MISFKLWFMTAIVCIISLIGNIKLLDDNFNQQDLITKLSKQKQVNSTKIAQLIDTNKLTYRWGDTIPLSKLCSTASIIDKNPGNKRPVGGEIGLVGSRTLADSNVNAVYSRYEYGIYNKLRDFIIKYSGNSAHTTVWDRTSSGRLYKRNVDKFNTIKDLVLIWAPIKNANPNYNPKNTYNYIKYVSNVTGIPATKPFSPEDIPAISQAMMSWESGFSIETIDQIYPQKMIYEAAISLLSKEPPYKYYEKVEQRYN